VVIQWDKDDCAEMGIVKVDLLGLGMMAVLQDAIELVNVEVPRSAECGVRIRTVGMFRSRQ
jgi:DNA polymerase III alpha subunit